MAELSIRRRPIFLQVSRDWFAGAVVQDPAVTIRQRW
jgi:hypothetical protein